jgi:phenylalanine-4-hydroxylase
MAKPSKTKPKAKKTKYVAKVPDASGYIPYTEEEDETWSILISRQRPIAERYACREWLEACDRMRFPTDRIPQCVEVSKALQAATGWSVYPCAALINFDDFFALLANKQFPAASFIRTRDELEYLQEPDIFHEIFGHTPLLTDPRFAEFTHTYGKLGLAADKKDRVFLARLYWFTVEFGLIRQGGSFKTYGAGIVSSMGETPYSIDSDKAQRRRFVPLDVLRTPYRIDIFQTVYYWIEDLDELYNVAHTDVMALVAEARCLGMFEPTYPPAEKKVSWA